MEQTVWLIHQSSANPQEPHCHSDELHELPNGHTAGEEALGSAWDEDEAMHRA